VITWLHTLGFGTRIAPTLRSIYKAQYRVLRLAALSTAFLALPALASASAITFTFDGTVTLVSPLLVPGPFAVTDAMSGSLTYDSTLSDTDATAAHGRYAPLSSFAMTVDGYDLTFVNGSGRIDVQNGPSGSDSLVFTADVTGTTVNGFHPFRVSLSLTDTTSAALSNDSLPSAFNSSQFSLNSFIISFSNRANPDDLTSGGTNFTGVSGTFTGRAGAAAVVTPEPATLTLLGGGFTVLAFRLRRQRRTVPKPEA